ncbi:MAG: hypothetical protein KBB86_01185 [Candidatus Pacebacteria bacterium]|nr:hypothetical protein [Candidatus Paceibacterota bacterium]
MKRNKSFNRDHHPERLPDEVYVTNSDRAGIQGIGWRTKRVGNISYTITGKKSEQHEWFPIFVKISEIRASKDWYTILRSLLPTELLTSEYTLHKLNAYNQQVVDHATTHGLNLTKIRRACGIGFAVKLFNYLYKQTCKKVKVKKSDKFINLIFPKKYCRHEFNYKKHYDSYIETLEDAGIKFNKWTEDFVDEDTGEVVTLHRANFKLIK